MADSTSPQPQITEVDWPPAVQQFPDDPADTPGWIDDSMPAISGPTGAD